MRIHLIAAGVGARSIEWCAVLNLLNLASFCIIDVREYMQHDPGAGRSRVHGPATNQQVFESISQQVIEKLKKPMYQLLKLFTQRFTFVYFCLLWLTFVYFGLLSVTLPLPIIIPGSPIRTGSKGLARLS